MQAVSHAISRLLGRPHLTILMYHGVIAEPMSVDDWCFLDVERFQRQMRWLANSRFDVLPLVEAAELLMTDRLQRPAVAITFDDGYRNNIEVALPILQDLSLPATIFLTTGLTGTPHGLWPSRINDAVARSTHATVSWEGRTFDLSSREARKKASPALQSMVKDLAGADPNAAAASVELALGRPANPELIGDPALSIMDQPQIDRALGTGLVEFGAHTVTHPVLSRLDDERLAIEIDQSIAAVERFTGRQCRCFAYPNGGKRDFDDRAVERLRSRGIAAAVSTLRGPNFKDADPLRLRRWGIGSGGSFLAFRAKVQNLAPITWRR